jgi:hypothetical protein
MFLNIYFTFKMLSPQAAQGLFDENLLIISHSPHFLLQDTHSTMGFPFGPFSVPKQSSHPSQELDGQSHCTEDSL